MLASGIVERIPSVQASSFYSQRDLCTALLIQVQIMLGFDVVVVA